MKLHICLLTIILFTGLTLSKELAGSDYPRATITPSRIVKGDTVKLNLTLAQGTSSCVPTYSKISYTIERQPQDTFPPKFNLNLTYDEIPAKAGPCLAVLTGYGPQFTFTDLEQGNYTCIDKNNGAVATFRVLKNDSIYYEVSTLKELYSKGQKLDVTYKVKNNSTHSVRFNFSSSCQFDMTLTNSTSTQVYHYMDELVCGAVLTELSLQAGEEKRFEFPVFDLNERYGQLTITAQMIGYEESAVSKKIMINETTNVINSAEKVSFCNRYTWNSFSKILTFNIDKEMYLSLKLFSATGKHVESIFPSKLFTAGSHTISLPDIHNTHGVFFVRFEGEYFTQTIKLIRL